METKIQKQTNNNEIKKEATITKTETKKDLGVKKYTIKFGMNYEKESEDKIFVTLNISNDLKELLNEVAVKSLSQQDYAYKDNKTNKRYRCKTWLYDSLFYTEKDILLDKELIDSGNLEISFLSINSAEEFINNIKVCMQDIIKKIMQYKDFGEEVTYTVTR